MDDEDVPPPLEPAAAPPSPVVRPLPTSLSSACVFASPAIPDAPADLDAIRAGVVALAESEAMDKPTALQVTRLFHSMELLLRHEKHVRDRQIADLKNDLERTRLETELERFARRHTLEEMQQQQQVDAAPIPRHGRSVRR